MSKVLVDTNLIVNYDRGDEFDFSLLWDLVLFGEVELVTSVVVTYEYFLGVPPHKKYLKLAEDKFKFMDILPINKEIALKAAQINRIHQIGMGDALIAATCLVHNFELATHNKKHFRQIKGLKLWQK